MSSVVPRPTGAIRRAWNSSLPFRFALSALFINTVLLTVKGVVMVEQVTQNLRDDLTPDHVALARAAMQEAVAWTAFVFLPLSAIAMFVLALQVVRPLRSARLTAEALARGELDNRMTERGPEDEAALARSLNHMADELQSRIEAQERAAQQQMQFVSDVAHELRTPLTTVHMAADVMYDFRDELSPVTARSAELLMHEVDRFENLLNDLLILSRIDAGAAVLAAEEQDFSQLVAEEVKAQLPLAETYGSELVVDAPAGCMATIDSVRVRRIVSNLLSNAIEHGEGHPIEITVRDSESAVALAVRDHGVGLSEAEQEHVFTRFWRADPSRVRAVGGTGLGLAIALQNAELHGGRLELWGAPKRGAQFVLTLPREPRRLIGIPPIPRVPADA